MSTAPDIVLSLEGLSKVFQGQRALDGVDLDLRRGEIHALLGQNGSGKSTLIKILAGYHQPETGAVASLYGQPFDLGSVAAAHDGGIRFIHQDLGLVTDLDSVDNLALGARYNGSWWLSDRRERRAARARLADYGVHVDVTAPVHTLSAAQQSMVAIVRALESGLGDDGLLVLDEPTAALPDQEVQHLFELLGELRRRGGTILYVTHRLGEVFEIADRVTVLRDGARVATRPTAELDHDTLVELIIGRPLEAFYPEPPEVRADVVLDVSGLAGDEVAEASLQVHRGEIVGVTGLLGSGYEQLLSLIFGGRAPSRGAVAVDGAPVSTGSPPAAIAAGLAFAPADRKRLSSILTWTVRENLTLPKIRSRGPSRWLSASRERADAQPWLRRLDVVPPDPERLFSSLSGGNQQKVVLARWLRCGAKAFLLEEPTNGVDMGAKHAIYTALAEVAGKGAAVLFSSSDSEELCSVCDRVIVMRNGRIGAHLDGASLTVDRLLAETIHAKANGLQPAETHHV